MFPHTRAGYLPARDDHNDHPAADQPTHQCHQTVGGRGDKEDDHGGGGVSSNLSINSFSRLAYNLLKFDLERLVNAINVNFRIGPLH